MRDDPARLMTVYDARTTSFSGGKMLRKRFSVRLKKRSAQVLSGQTNQQLLTLPHNALSASNKTDCWCSRLRQQLRDLKKIAPHLHRDPE